VKYSLWHYLELQKAAMYTTYLNVRKHYGLPDVTFKRAYQCSRFDSLICPEPRVRGRRPGRQEAKASSWCVEARSTDQEVARLARPMTAAFVMRVAQTTRGERSNGTTGALSKSFQRKV
jgi:hypothetical protein